MAYCFLIVLTYDRNSVRTNKTNILCLVGNRQCTTSKMVLRHQVLSSIFPEHKGR